MNALIRTLVLAAAFAASAPVFAAQPHMEAALTALQQAKQELQSATADKGGHRAKSIKAVEFAIKQVQDGIAFDKSHPGDK
jgi:hypothetical protein